MCKTQIDVHPLIDVQSSNSSPISTSQTSVPQIYVLFSNSQIGVPILKSTSFFKFSNRHSILKSTSLTYALTLILTNKSAIDLKIWKGRQFENTL